MTGVAARALTYAVGNATLVDGVDLVVSDGEFVAIVGPNGAGKSTLIGLLAGDLRPSAGGVELLGEDLAGVPVGELALRRAVLKEQGVADIPFDVRAVVAMGRYPHRLDPDNTQLADITAVGEALDRTSTSHLAGRVFATLSGGERTRVSLARVFAQDAPVLLLDEPTTALDVAHQERVMIQMRFEARRERAVVAVLHDLNAAAYYADRVILMAEGAIRAEGPPRGVFVEKILSEVYRQRMRIIDHPFRDCPLILVAD